MSGRDAQFSDAIGRILEQGCGADVIESAHAGQWPGALWQSLEDAGTGLLLVPETRDGVGATIGEAMAVVRVLGRYSVPLPAVESIVANWILSRAGAPAVPGPLTVAPFVTPDSFVLTPTVSGWALRGRTGSVPWARDARAIVFVVRATTDQWLAMSVPARACEIRPAANLAGEPRDEVIVDAHIAAPNVHQLGGQPDPAESLVGVGALCRCHQMVGAMQWILERSVAYAQERSQFGKPIGQFQAVQQMLAVMAGATAAAATAANAAIRSVESGADDLDIAFAKARVGEAAGEVAALGHQIHGAIGYSREYPLHHRSRRLWAWRDEFGSESYWSARAGRRLASAGADVLWAEIADAAGAG